MNELPPHLAALIEAARSGHDPSPSDAQRVHAALMASLSGGALPSGAEQAGSATAAAGSSSLVSKLLIVGVLVGGAAGSLTWMRASAPPRPSATVAAFAEAPEPNEREPAAAPTQGRASGAVGAPAVHPASARAQAGGESASPSGLEAEGSSSAGHSSDRTTLPAARAPNASSRRDRSARPPSERSDAVVQPSPKTSQPAESASALASTRPGPAHGEELALIRATLAALRDDAPRRALELLAQHEARFAHGVLSQERRGLRVVALCALGEHAAGKREQAAFLALDARSPLAQRVRGACSAESP